MIRKKKSYIKPRKTFEASRIAEENELVAKYGLKNKKEIWKTKAKIDYFRKRAMALASSPPEEQEVLFNKLRNIGLKINTNTDVLDLKVENLLERRLPTIIAKKGLSTTVRQARQLVTHKKILISGKVTNSPSYIVKVAEENEIKVKQKLVPKPQIEKPEVQEAPAEVKEVPVEQTKEVKEPVEQPQVNDNKEVKEEEK